MFTSHNCLQFRIGDISLTEFHFGELDRSQDELVWGATWLYKATKENSYLQYLIRNGNSLGGATQTVQAFSWDNKYAGAQVLLAQSVMQGVGGIQAYKDRADGFVCAVLPRSISNSNQLQYTKGTYAVQIQAAVASMLIL